MIISYSQEDECYLTKTLLICFKNSFMLKKIRFCDIINLRFVFNVSLFLMIWKVTLFYN